MNPFEAPQAKLEAPIEPNEPKSIVWRTISAAGLVYFISSLLIYAAVAVVNIAGLIEVPPPVWIVCFFAPWVLGAMYLAWKTKGRWIAHGLIYAAIPPMLLSILAAVTLQQFAFLLLFYTPIAMLISIFITLATVSITRLVLGAIPLFEFKHNKTTI